MICFPNCKINIGLNIVYKREDGYHNIESCFYPVPWTDILEIIDSENLQFEISGLPVPGNEADNLVLKAYQLLKNDFDLPPVKIRLHKIIPMGAGLGGGSADAAFVLKLLNDKFELNLNVETLQKYALQLGSDCPFFIDNKPKFVTGRGELFEDIKIDLQGYWLMLVHPGIHIGTAEAYAGIIPTAPVHNVKIIIENEPISKWKYLLVNDFEKTVFQKAPAIEKIKKSLYEQGALYSSMSGSGSAVYGIFDKEPDLNKDPALITKTIKL